MERKKEANVAFSMILLWMSMASWFTYFGLMLQAEKTTLIFGDLVSFDATYSTNQYNMIFAPFTGVNHHMQSVFFGGAFIVNEKIESYEWLFQTFLLTMDGKAPKLIITDEDASMK